MQDIRRPLFRLRLHAGKVSGFLVRHGPRAPAEGPSATIEIVVGGRTAALTGEGELGCVPSAVALLRSVFEDHHVDPEHRCCLFFNSYTIGTSSVQYDFSVTHQGDAVLLSCFTFPPFQDGPPVRVPLSLYAQEVVGFARTALMMPEPTGLVPWALEMHRAQRAELRRLLRLASAFVAGGCRDLAAYQQRFQAEHGCKKRPLELQVLRVLIEGDPCTDPSPLPWVVEARVVFGPISVHELVPMRLNGGDLVLVRALAFDPGGVRLAVMGVGSGGLRPGDTLRGLQLFYP